MTADSGTEMPAFRHQDDFMRWFEAQRARTAMTVTQVPLQSLASWMVDSDTGCIRHRSGRFFSIDGIRVHDPRGQVTTWDQPIIHQPEVGILGILVRRSPVDGRYEFLMQAKREPGNPLGLQLSPTVQATRSNYLGVHGGKSVPYLEHFRAVDGHRVHADSRQSEQGAWFYRKRNRNMLIEAPDRLEYRSGFCWMDLHGLYELLRVDDLVNMDARTVLACVPRQMILTSETAEDQVSSAITQSLSSTGPCPDPATLSWLTESRIESDLTAEPIPLSQARRWSMEDGIIRHDSGGHFTILGVSVQAHGREVSQWEQPMLAPVGVGVVGVLVTVQDGKLEVLMRSRSEAGSEDGLELGPTVQSLPDSVALDPNRTPPQFLSMFLDPKIGEVLYDVEHAEEGGRFFFARNRYVILRATDRVVEPPGFRWFTLDQLAEFMRHSFYVNVQARTIFLCVVSLLNGNVQEATREHAATR